MLYYNPDYKHKADSLVIKLQLDRVEPLNEKRGGNNNPYGCKGRDNNQVDNVNLINKETKGGNNSDYLLAKLKRDLKGWLDYQCSLSAKNCHIPMIKE